MQKNEKAALKYKIIDKLNADSSNELIKHRASPTIIKEKTAENSGEVEFDPRPTIHGEKVNG